MKHWQKKAGMKKALLFIIIMMIIEMFALACSDMQEEEKEDYQFYYYPQKNVYYDVEKNYFYYSLNGGKTWDSTTNTSGNDPGTLGKKVIIRSLIEEVYKDNETHRILYKGKLYNFYTDTALASAAREVTERKVVKKSNTTEVTPIPEKDKPKKGLKKFLKKIFGKHNKKTTEADSLQ